MSKHKAKQLNNKEKNKKTLWIFSLFIAIIIFLIYNKTLSFDFLFTWDDHLYITRNQYVRNFTWDNFKLLLTGFHASNYHPLTMIFYAVEFLVTGEKATLFHFNNILLHIINSILVFVFIKQISPKSIYPALITSVFFAVHPMHVESVAWISERKDVLYTFFFLLAIIQYNLYVKNLKLKYLYFTGIFFLLSCFSKSAAVVLPLILLLLDYYKDRNLLNKRVIFEKIPFILISILFGILAILSQKTTIDAYQYNFSLLERLAMISYSFFIYIIKAVVPYSLTAIYPYPSDLKSIPSYYYFSLLIIPAIIIIMWYSRKFSKNVIFGISFFIISIILVLQIIPVGNAMMAERYTYVPYIGIFFMLGKLIEHFHNISLKNTYKSINRVFIIITLIFAIAFSIISYKRTLKWENDEILFTDVLKKYPECSIAYINKGWYNYNYLSEYVYNSNFPKRKQHLIIAIEDFKNAIKYAAIPETKVKAYYNSATAKAAFNKHNEAIKDFDKALEIDPEYYAVYVNRGNSKLAINDMEGALKDLNFAIKKIPDLPVAWNSRAKIKGLQGDYYAALADINKAIELDPFFVEAYNNRANAKSALNDKQGALLDYNKAISLNPHFDQLYVNRGINKVEMGDYNGAVQDFNKALKLNPQNTVASQWINNLTAGSN